MSRKASYTEDELKTAVEQSDSWAGVLRRLNLKSGQAHIIQKSNKLGFDSSHFMGQSWAKNKLAIEDDRIKSSKNATILFTENSLSAISYCKNVILKYDLLPYKCKCGVSKKWENDEIKLQLHHKNGIRSDNRLENLQWLCPNCHSQTDTYGGKNSVKIRVSDDRLISALELAPSIRQALLSVGLENGRNYARAKRMVNINKIVFLKRKSNPALNLPRPNCRKVKNRPSKEELTKLISENSWTALGKMFGVSGNAIRKWARYYKLVK